MRLWSCLYKDCVCLRGAYMFVDVCVCVCLYCDVVFIRESGHVCMVIVYVCVGACMFVSVCVYIVVVLYLYVFFADMSVW